MKNERTVRITIGLILSLVGIGLLVIGTLLIVDRIEKEKTFIDTTGIVIGFNSHGGYDENLYDNYFYEDVEYAPIVKYVVGGEYYETNHNVYSYPPKYRIGQRVSLKYNPNNPRDVVFK